MRLFVLSVIAVFSGILSASAQNTAPINPNPTEVVGEIVKDVYRSAENADSYILVVRSDVKKENYSCRISFGTVGDSAIFPINASREYFLSRLVRGEKISVHGTFDKRKEFLLVDGLIVDGERFNWPFGKK